MTDCTQKIYQNAGNLPLLNMLSGTAGRVLDCGCGAGDNARILRERGWAVTGITINADEQRLASAYCEHVYIADLNRGIPDSLGGGYDLVLLSHVLEHLAHPQEFLHDIKNRLAPEGMLAVALPNILFYSYRLRFFFGRFEYESGGIMDDTHLRFFTFATGAKMLVSNGYKLVKADADGIFPLWKIRNIMPRSLVNTMNRISARHWPGLFGHQSLYIAQVAR